MKTLILGAEGQLGSALARLYGTAAKGFSRNDLDLLDHKAIARRIAEEAPTVIINTAAYTAVDRAETDRDMCFAINARAVEALASAANQCGALLVQISTDYVFAGNTERVPFREQIEPRPLGVYASSKLQGERAAANANRHLIVRTCGLYGKRAKPTQTNFVDTMLRLGKERPRLRVVNDQRCTPSYVEHVARAVKFLADRGETGLLHVTNQGATTWHELAVEIFKLAKMNVEVEPITTAEYGAAAPRPAYSVLDISRYQSLGGPELPHWKNALGEYLHGAP